MKKLLSFVLLFLSLTVLFACSGGGSGSTVTDTADPSGTGNAGAASDTAGDSSGDPEGGVSVSVGINGKTFTATLMDNDTAREFAGMLPVTLEMSELNGNEKYSYLDRSLHGTPVYPGGIIEGDIMLYGDNCLVLFYETFQTVYSYARIGRIDDPAGLKEALGDGEVSVTFSLN